MHGRDGQVLRHQLKSSAPAISAAVYNRKVVPERVFLTPLTSNIGDSERVEVANPKAIRSLSDPSNHRTRTTMRIEQDHYATQLASKIHACNDPVLKRSTFDFVSSHSPSLIGVSASASILFIQ